MIGNILKLFNQATEEDYRNIVEQCDAQIKTQKDNASWYYFRAMAKFGIAISLKLDNKLLFNALPIGIAGGLGLTSVLTSASISSRNRWNKFEEHYKIADLAVEDYNKALLLDNNIQKKFNHIKIKVSSDFTDTDFIFYRPIPTKDLMNLLAGNKKWTLFLIFLGFWFILPFILLHFYGDGSGNFNNTGLAIELTCSLGLILYALFTSNIDTRILKKYGNDIVVIKKSNDNKA